MENEFGVQAKRHHSNLSSVPGRMQNAGRRTNGAPVFVDYAHTPEALKTALTSLRPHVLGKLNVVFGAGAREAYCPDGRGRGGATSAPQLCEHAQGVVIQERPGHVSG